MSKIMTVEELAQWVIDNRYPKSENNKVSDHEMYHTIIDTIKAALPEYRQVAPTPLTYIPQNEGWNACIDEIKQNTGIK